MKKYILLFIAVVIPHFAFAEYNANYDSEHFTIHISNNCEHFYECDTVSFTVIAKKDKNTIHSVGEAINNPGDDKIYEFHDGGTSYRIYNDTSSPEAAGKIEVWNNNKLLLSEKLMRHDIDSVVIDKSIWQRIDNLNASLTQAKKPVPAEVIGAALAEAVAILNNKNFQRDYDNLEQDVVINNFSAQGDSLIKRASPAFSLAFGGDSAHAELSWNYFSSLAKPNSEAAEFLKSYYRYPLFAANDSCILSIPFDQDIISDDSNVQYNEDGQPIPRKISDTEKKQELAKWNLYVKKWQTAFFKDTAKQIIGCLNGA